MSPNNEEITVKMSKEGKKFINNINKIKNKHAKEKMM